jgi:CheY-like chemotaxis protein
MIKTVLLVDDNQAILQTLKAGLTKFSNMFSVITAKNGVFALEKLKMNTISLVVTDLKMDRMDGFALLANILKNYPDIPVIIITGYATPESERLAKEGVVAGHLAKPFKLDSLAHKIKTTLNKESEGGTLIDVALDLFLQLIEMEQKTCTTRLIEKHFGRQGVLFFLEGELLDARVKNLHGKDAALQIFSWDEVTLSIQNDCPLKENKIQTDLQALLLEAMRLKDEDGEKEKPATDLPAEQLECIEQIQFVDQIKTKLEKEIGDNWGLEDIYQDKSWDRLIAQFTDFGTLINAGKFKVGYLDRGESEDFILVPGEETTVILVNPRCPRDRIIQTIVA